MRYRRRRSIALVRTSALGVGVLVSSLAHLVCCFRTRYPSRTHDDDVTLSVLPSCVLWSFNIYEI